MTKMVRSRCQLNFETQTILYIYEKCHLRNPLYNKITVHHMIALQVPPVSIKRFVY